MRILFVVCSMVLWCVSIHAQDLIVKHNGEQIPVKVSFSTSSDLHYRDIKSGESLVIAKPLVEKIIFENGIVEMVSPKILINGPSEWDKVVLTDNPLKVKGLSPLGELSVRTISSIKLSGANGYEKKELNRIKKEAAKRGGHIIFLTKKDLEVDRHGQKEWAIIYGY